MAGFQQVEVAYQQRNYKRTQTNAFVSLLFVI